MTSNTYTSYRTDRPNILGGYMTYFHLSDALAAPHNEVWAVTKVKNHNNIGEDTNGYLFKVLWETRIK